MLLAIDAIAGAFCIHRLYNTGFDPRTDLLYRNIRMLDVRRLDGGTQDLWQKNAFI